MSLDLQYIASIDLQEYLVDKDTGLPLAGGYIEFYEDNSRTTPKTVFELTGSPPNYTYSALPNPLVLSEAGTTVNSSGNYTPIYYYPFDEEGNIQHYYIAVYNSGGTLQYTLEGWPNIGEQDNPATSTSSAANQLSNPQFVDVLFQPNDGLTISFSSALIAESYQIAPDWELIITSTGAGTVALEQVALEGTLNIETNPPYTLSIQPTGGTITELTLRQTLSKNPNIWSTTPSQDGYLSGIMLISSLDGQAHTLEMQYVQSSGSTSPQTVVSGSTLTEGYNLLNDTVLLASGTNTEAPPEGSIYIDIILPTSGYYSVTSLQVSGLESNTTIQYEQETANRQIDHLFHYYKPQLEFKPIRSYLTAWDFPLNPAQITESSVSLDAVPSDYLWDQTIGFQSVNSSLNISRQSAGDSVGGIKLTAAADAQFALVQYQDSQVIKSMLVNDLSSNILLSTDQANTICTISLWYTTDAALPNINTDNKSLVLTLDANGKPASFNGTWVEVPRGDLGNATFTTSSSTDLNDLQNFGFSGWSVDLSTLDLSTVTYFSIVVGFSELASNKNIVVKSCSLVPGHIPTIPATQTAEEVLSECRYYYEKSYELDTPPATITTTAMVRQTQPFFYDWGAEPQRTKGYTGWFEIKYRITKRIIPIVTFYSYLDGATDEVVYTLSDGASYYGGSPFNVTVSSTYTLIEESTNNLIYYNAQNNPAPIVDEANANPSTESNIFIQFVADARLGVF